MKINKENGIFSIIEMCESDVKTLLSMIKGAGLQERRHWYDIKCRIEKLLGL